MRLRLLPLTAAVLAAMALTACAGRQPPKPDYDPWESLNRKTFAFNETVDSYLLEPVARGWDFVVPDPAQRCLSHFFNNLRFPIVFVNNILQWKLRKAVESVARLQINTFIGVLGLFDVAADFGVPRQDQDTGVTLGVWDIAPGPYLVLPFLGPSSPRDAVGLAGDAALGFYTYFVTVPGLTVGASAINVVNERARFLDVIKNAKEASLDYYTFLRNAFVQRRWKQISGQATEGGKPLEEDLYNEEIFENYLEHGDTP